MRDGLTGLIMSFMGQIFSMSCNRLGSIGNMTSDHLCRLGWESSRVAVSSLMRSFIGSVSVVVIPFHSFYL